jgi:6-phosphogluconolactonase
LNRLLVLVLAVTSAIASADDFDVYVGTYTAGDSKSEGIYHARFNSDVGSLKLVGLAARADNPSFLAVHPKQNFVYAVNELGGTKGAVQAFEVQADRSLNPVNQQSSEGGAPCHLVVDPAGKNVLVANYMGGNVAVLPLANDGSLKAASSIIRHRGSSINLQRQKEPHAHSINVSSDGRFAFAADLGADRVFQYRFDSELGLLTENQSAAVTVQPGGGPRHFAWHPSGKFAYVNSELTAAVTVFQYDKNSGRLAWLQTIETLPADFQGRKGTAEICVHPSGRFLYCSNRGHDSIAVFRIDESSGKLSKVEHEPTGGREPRNFVIEPNGRFLLAANQKSDTVVVLTIDQVTGALSPTGQTMQVPRPVCLRFLPLKNAD